MGGKRDHVEPAGYVRLIRHTGGIGLKSVYGSGELPSERHIIENSTNMTDV